MDATATADRPTKGTKHLEAPPWLATVDLKLYSEEIQSIKAVAIAASTDRVRHPLDGINIVGDGERLTLTATDSYRLHHATITTDVKTSFDVTIPAAWLIKTIREVKPNKKAMHRTVGNAFLFGGGR